MISDNQRAMGEGRVFRERSLSYGKAVHLGGPGGQGRVKYSSGGG
jgi:hypothetical protein